MAELGRQRKFGGQCQRGRPSTNFELPDSARRRHSPPYVHVLTIGSGWDLPFVQSEA